MVRMPWAVPQGSRLLRLDEQILAVDLHQPGTFGLPRGPAQNVTGGHVELAAMASAGDGSAIERPRRQ